MRYAILICIWALACPAQSDGPREAFLARGNTPLMYAALYESSESMKALLEQGAGVNAAGAGGITPLMTAIGDIEKVRLLVEKGADVNAKSAAGNTPILLASRLPGAAAVVRYLMSKGATPSVAILRNELRHGNAGLARELTAAGVRLDASAASLLATSSAAPPEFLKDALGSVEGKLPPPTSRSQTTALMVAAFAGSADHVRLLLASGAEINVRDNRGRTALMHAVSGPRPNAAVVRALLDAGADGSLKDVRGDTAADWAAHRGDAAVMKILGAMPARPPEPQIAGKLPPVREALTRALSLLDDAGPKFFKANGCISCHNQSIPQMAYGALRAAGVRVSAEGTQTHTKAVLATWTSELTNMWQTSCAVGGGQVATMTYGLAGLAAAGQERTLAIDGVVHCLLAVQDADGSWNLPDLRAPLGIGRAKFTALAIRGLRQYTIPGRQREIDERVVHALRFLESTTEDDTQALAMRILGLRWSGGGDPKLIAKLAGQLTVLQRGDGGWGQRPELAPDAYATGQALWALAEGAGRSPSDRAYRRGAEFLRRTQQADGSWHVRTRGFGFQPYRETGFPHGHDQWLSAAATGFAILGLAPMAAAESASSRPR